MSGAARLATSAHSPARFSRSTRACHLLCVLVGALGMHGALAIGLGPASVSSALGEPLRLAVPVSVQPDEEVGCIQVRPGGGDLPAVFDTRAQVVRSGAATRIEIRSAQPVNEPAVGLVVSVGCSSPVARDYVLFLDPPVLTPADATTVAGSALRRLNPMPTPVRRASGTASGPAASDDGAPAPQRVRPRPPRPRPRVVPTAPTAPTAPLAEASAEGARRAVPPPVAPPAAASGSDRLSVVPTEPASAATSAAVASDGATAGPAATVGAAAAATEAAAREDALRQQQAQLQAQLKSLSDQITALRVQATTLSERNLALERQSTSPWWLIVLAVVAILLAAWMAWRYLQLRRSVEGSAWWSANTVQPAGMTSDSRLDSGTGEGNLDPGTRMVARPLAKPDPRDTAAAATFLAGTERAKPVVRPTAYPAAIDTDFTVSDIEAAMATVRTVSPPRPPATNKSLVDSDFAPLGGPTLPSPFSDPPPGASRAAPSPRSVPAAPPDNTSSGQFIDFDIPPLQPTAGSPPTAPRSAASFKLGGPPAQPPEAFDPLASNSMKTTIFESGSDAQDAPTSLDFELPTATQIMALTQVDESLPTAEARHGGTLLDDLFQTSNGPGIDTILDLDERHGAPLSMTEVDRLISTDVAEAGSAETRLPRTRMAKFADLVNRVDELATSEPLQAIAQLRQFVLRDERIPTLLWLRLFELYRQVDKKPVYNALADHFARRYHRPMVPWGQSVADRVPQTPLAAHAELDREIESSWGTEEGRTRLESLLCDHDQDDTIVFNAVLQHDLLDAAKIFPALVPPDGGVAPGAAAA